VTGRRSRRYRAALLTAGLLLVVLAAAPQAALGAGVSAGGGTTCTVRPNGTLWCWGLNGFSGQLGLGDMADRHAPARAGAATSWRQVRPRAGDR
jgi:Regulator of Chromosome Condensation (RCC1) repeat protein